MNLSKIVVPVDFSLRSEKAVRYARVLADHFGAELVVAHVIEPLRFDYAMVEPSRVLFENAVAQRRRETQVELDNFARDVARATRIVADGDPAEEIVRIALDQRADLIVMPTQGRSRIREFLIGSVTAKVLHDSPIPVLTGVHLHEEEHFFPDFHVRHVLCAIDLGPQSAAVLKAAADVSRHFGASVSVMHVVAELNGLSAAITADRKTQHVRDIHERLLDLTQGIGLTANCYVEHGEAQKVVPAKAREAVVDLVVIGRGATNHVVGRLRAQAYGIVRQAPCPVLSV